MTKKRGDRQDTCRSPLDRLFVDRRRKELMKLTIFFLLSLAVLSSASAAEAQNCPNDWHPPPCGAPPPPVKSPLLPIVKDAERFHWKAAQLFGMAVAATCGSKVGDPRFDRPLMFVCRMSTFVGAVTLGFQQWEQRLIEEINAARDGGTQFVAMLDPPPSFSVDMDSEGNPYLENLREHGAAVEEIGQWIIGSVRTTFDCDAWAMYDIRGIECGDNQRAWTDGLLKAMGERYSAVSLNIDILISELDAEAVEAVVPGWLADLDDNSEVAGWEGWWLQQ